MGGPAVAPFPNFATCRLSDHRTHTSTYTQISPTADIVSVFRSISNIPYANLIVDTSLIKSWDSQTVARMSALFQARARSISAIFDSCCGKINQILELAAGFSTRGLDWSRNAQRTYVETDLPDVILRKRRAMTRVIAQCGESERPNLHLLPVDVFCKADLENATRIFNPDEQLAIITEGLLLYLNKDEIETISRNVAQLLKKHGGVWITDIVAQDSMETLSTHSKTGAFVSTVLKTTGRNKNNMCFKTEAEATAFFENLGFQIQTLPLSEAAAQITLPHEMALTVDQIKASLGNRKIWLLQLRSD